MPRSGFRCSSLSVRLMNRLLGRPVELLAAGDARCRQSACAGKPNGTFASVLLTRAGEIYRRAPADSSILRCSETFIAHRDDKGKLSASGINPTLTHL